MMLAVAFSSVINIAAGVLIPVCDSTPFTICFTFLCRNAQQEGSRLKVCGSGMGSFRCTLPPPHSVTVEFYNIENIYGPFYYPDHRLLLYGGSTPS